MLCPGAVAPALQLLCETEHHKTSLMAPSPLFSFPVEQSMEPSTTMCRYSHQIEPKAAKTSPELLRSILSSPIKQSTIKPHYWHLALCA
ncbi:hypothetical protein Nepgr_024673 [Nepenthes gracilis]|uniref:Uncharacterized protein n=1 Tax=Nepenthes gracilis TaxID=150966 RepID=A0AAD3Y0A4_NEPGR|nr:hypothetical protein Nepgr_024673 [Nepenthes gracilis]